ncbi:MULTISPECIES: HAMP domain-containing sensor histidine kinase [Bacillaceae]|uniref:histidine kinase n=1 Tax=Gottfriedia luciferensis TaxID=178774 RepID=A0ABX2ZWX7_9BACI|nr:MULTISPECIES: HAMP domain-containing sensor histidine kinase [Bacillaceae]ODG92889.1 two-component sensor histidine kinase [Gottfriedia luciferensis]PGZ93145.1 sensor histidine kinase [Bacillus sp. AFS029533]SFD35362.1 His Kinase A (phospho-acceptor) domain-containing protein [Bacillus sp. UNCCL81]
MFKKTKIRLTIINSVVFILIIGILSLIIYSYTNNRLYKEVDQSLLWNINRIQNSDNPNRLPISNRDPRVLMIMWDENKKLVNPMPGMNAIILQDELKYPTKINEIYNDKIGDMNYRTISIQGETNRGKITLQILRNIDSEKDLVDTLLIILIVGWILGSALSVVAGYILAGRALVPITNAWQKQQEFVSDASHEIRTPLTVIQSRLELLLREPDATIEEKAQDFSIMLKENRRLSKLVASLLTLARSDSGQIQLNKKIFSLNELLEEVVSHFTEIISFQSKEIFLSIKDTYFYFGDQERIHQLLVILIDNAMKFTNENDTIQISCKQVKNNFLIKVIDSGVGIKEENLPRIFDRFFQEDVSRTSKNGIGLGLSIAKWIVEEHGGKIKVQSEKGEGTSFEVSLPIMTSSKNS